MEFHAFTPQGATHVCTVHRGENDTTPLQIISGRELERLKQLEAAHRALLASLVGARKRSHKRP